jgi:large subunit ribosomal protein L2
VAIKHFKPTSPSRRYYDTQDFAGLSKKAPEKALLESKSSTGGRNHSGRVTSRFRGGGHKRAYRMIDWRRNKVGVPGTVAALEYDPNRSARIALIHYADGEKSYILAPDGLNAGRQGRGQQERRRQARQLHAPP